MVWHVFATTAVLDWWNRVGARKSACMRRPRALTIVSAASRRFKYARRLNAAQHATLPGQQGQRHRAPDELRNLPPVLPGFQLQFITDGRTYTFSLKDSRDPCRFAVFSDQGGDVYAASPQRPGATIIPLETR